MPTEAPPDWDEDSPRLRQNLRKLRASIERHAVERALPTLGTAKAWHRQMMAGLAAGDVNRVGRFRGEAGLEEVWVHVDDVYGTAPRQVAVDVEAFETALQAKVAVLDRRLPRGHEPDEADVAAILELAAQAHSIWIAIHPFVNGNGRTARLWANTILMRYGLPAAIQLRPRPGGGYVAACAAAMRRGQWRPMVGVFRRLLDGYFDEPVRSTTRRGRRKLAS